MNPEFRIRRDNKEHCLLAEEFWRLAQAGQLSADDEVLGADGVWRRAATYAELAPWVPAASSSVSLGGFLLSAALGLLGVVGVYKIGQALVDEDFGGRHFPAWFRDELINAHLDGHGAYCPACERRVRIADLTVDHIVPWAKGGMTSRQNAQVICKRCNSQKRDKVGIVDHVRGRAA